MAAVLGTPLNDTATLFGVGSIYARLDASATLSGGSGPTGRITFQLYDDLTTCTFPIFTATKIVSGNGTYTASASG